MSENGGPQSSELPWRRTRILGRTLAYLGGREATILLSSVAFSFLVSIFPFIVLLLTLAAYLDWTELRETIFSAFYHFFPISQEFIIRNLEIQTRSVARMQVISFLILAWSVSAFFFSLEASLDSAYRVPRFRQFSRSQLLGTGLTLLFGLVAFAFMAAFRGFQIVAREWFAVTAQSRLWLEQAALVAMGAALTFLFVFLVLYFLPHRKRRVKQVALESLFAGLLWWVGNLIFRALVPFGSVQEIYGPFYVSVTLLLWALASGAILLGTARLSEDGFFSRRSAESSEESAAAPLPAD